jgi:ubiquitin
MPPKSRFTVIKRKNSSKKSRFNVRTLKELAQQNPQLYELHINQKRKNSSKKSRFNVRTLKELAQQNPKLFQLHRNTY